MALNLPRKFIVTQIETLTWSGTILFRLGQAVNFRTI